MECPACRATVPDGARFCPSCGHGMTLVADERRVVTVLFADLVGFTTLSEGSDPEQVKNVVDRCFQRLVAVVESHGGKVDKIIGDAVVALFGAPVAHEDDAERAVRAALAMQELLATTGPGDGLELRVGVNTGEVLVGALRAGGDYTAMGDVVNTAQRLETAAAPGEVLVGPATREATAASIVYEPRGALEVKGRAEAVDAWLATGAQRPPGYRSRRDDGPLVGRRAELALLTAAVDTAVTNRRAQFLLLVGDAGVGKSRVANEVATYARVGHDALVLEGRCVPYGEANVWWPVAEALRQAAGIDGDLEPAGVRVRLGDMVAKVLARPGNDAEVLRITEGLLHLMGHVGPLRDLDPARAREEAARAVLAVIEAFAARSPVVVVLADLHWADAQVLAFVDDLMERLGRLPFALVGTARHAIHDRWSPRAGRHNQAVVHLEPLDREAASALLDSLLGWAPDDDLRAVLLDRAGGNPFFLEELVTLLVETGEVGQPTSPSPTGDLARLPDNLRGLIQARLDALTAEERFVLEDAAMLGRRGTRDAVAIMSHQYHGIADVGPALAGLAEKELLELDEDRWSFRSDLVRDVAYGTLTKARRAAGHAGIAKWMEQHAPLRGTGGSAAVDRIAHHYALAAELVTDLGSVPGVPGDVRERALQWLDEATRGAVAAEHHLVGLRLTTQVLGLTDDETGPEAVTARIRRARCAVGLRSFDDARADLTKALAHADTRGDQIAYGEALVVLGDLEMKAGDGVTATEILTRAADLLGAEGAASLRGEALRLRGMAELSVGERQAAVASIGEALDVARAVGDQRLEAWAHQNLAWTAFEAGQADLAASHLESSVAAFTAIGDTGGLGWAQGLLAWVRFYRGEHADAEELAERLLPEVRSRGDKWAEGMLLLLLAATRLWTGRAQEALPVADDAVAALVRSGDLGAEIQAMGLRARVLVATGRIDEGLEVMAAAHAASAGSDLPFGFAGLVTALLVPVALGRVDLAEPVLAELDPEILDPESVGQSDALVGVALALLQGGEAARAVALLGRMAGAAEPAAHPNSGAALALARVAAGDLDVDDLVAGVLSSRGATYHDRMEALLAATLAAVAAGDRVGALDRARAAADVVTVTQDRLAQTVVAAVAEEVLGPGSVPGAGLAGVDAEGWRAIARQALAATSVEELRR